MKVILEFDSQQAANNFMGWWLDGGGEQELDFESSSWNLDAGYIRVEGSGTSTWEEDEESKD